MAMQQTNSSFAKKLGTRVAAANAEHRDKPIDTGMRRLPAGIKAGIAKLQFMYTKEQDKDDGKTPKGETFFRASAVVLGQVVNGVLVEDHKGVNIKGLTTAVIIPLCDVPEKAYTEGKREAVSFEQNWDHFQNLFKMLSNGSIVFPEKPIDHKIDPAGALAQGMRIQEFYFAAMPALTNPKFPIYVDFSTEEFKPKKRAGETDAQYAAREGLVIEKWHGLAQLPSNGQYNPAAGVVEGPPQHTTSTYTPGQPLPPPPQTRTAPTQGAAPTPTNGPPPQYQPEDNSGNNDEVAGLVEVAMSDPESKTPDGAAATTQLEEMAWARGWTKEQTGAAKDWSEVGQMALSGLDEVDKSKMVAVIPAVGTRFMYAKRTKEGVKYKDNKGQEFPPSECEITSVNTEAKTCTLKTVHDGKDVTDIRTKKPVDVKFEWLETAPPF